MTCRVSGLVRGRQSGSATAATPLMATWDAVLSRLLAEADAAEEINGTISVDSTIARAHQHGTNTTRPDQPTGGSSESHESATRGAEGA